MISHVDHVYSYLRDNDLDETLQRFQRAGFLIGATKARHSCGRLTGFAHMTASYLEFLSVTDEGTFRREASLDDRYFRLNPRPFGAGMRTMNARALHRSLRGKWTDLPAVIETCVPGSSPRTLGLTICLMPRTVFPGITLFAVQYHLRKKESGEVRFGPNTIFALCGLVFCTDDIPNEVSRWRRNLSVFCGARRSKSIVAIGAQKLEWISPAEYRHRHGVEFQGNPLGGDGIAVVQLACLDLSSACRFLEAEGFRRVGGTARKARFAPDANTGYTFEVVQKHPRRSEVAAARLRRT